MKRCENKMEGFVFLHPRLPKVLCKWFSEKYLHEVDVYMWCVAFQDACLTVPAGRERSFLFTISKRGHEKLIKWFRRRLHGYHVFNNDVCCGLAAGEHYWMLNHYKTPNVCRDPEVIGIALAASRDTSIIDQLEQEMGFIVASPILRYITHNNDLETLRKVMQKYFPVSKLFAGDRPYMEIPEAVVKNIQTWWRGDKVYSCIDFMEDCLKYADDDYCCFVIDQCPSFHDAWLFELLAKEDRREIIMRCFRNWDDDEHFHGCGSVLQECLTHASFETFQQLALIKTKHLTGRAGSYAIFHAERDVIKKFEWFVNDLGIELRYDILRDPRQVDCINKTLLRYIVKNNYYKDISLPLSYLADSEFRPHVRLRDNYLTMLVILIVFVYFCLNNIIRYQKDLKK